MVQQTNRNDFKWHSRPRLQEIFVGSRGISARWGAVGEGGTAIRFAGKRKRSMKGPWMSSQGEGREEV